MTLRLRAVARTGAIDRADPDRAADAPLAGSATVWFDQIDLLRDGHKVDEVLYSDLETPAQQRLSAPRAPICGLTLDRPRVMGILNLTPDSFSDGGLLPTVAAAVTRARAMARVADILDLGGESTRPGAATIPEQEEIRRTVPVIRAIRDAGLTIPISIDTRKAEVAAAALDAGADLVNDVSGLTFDPAMAALVAARGVPVCIMHAQGDPATMQDDPRYDDALWDVATWLAGRVDHAVASGIARDRIIIDPGIGFGKTLQHNLTILRGLSLYHDLGCAILLGASRKRFIGTIGGAAAPQDRMPGSLAVALYGAGQGVHFLRVHDAAETRQALSLQQAIDGAE